MANFNKTEADFTYERYAKMGGVSPEQDIPADDIRLVGTETTQSVSEEASGSVRVPIESPFTSHDPVSAASIAEGIVYSDFNETLARDPKLAADVGLNAPELSQDGTPDREDRILGGPAPHRDELLRSDASLAAGVAGLIQGVIDYANDEWTLEDEIDPLEDIPDADDIQAGSPVDPASPSLDVMPGTDVLNGSTGEDE
ncbi:hypothetical protein SAMN04487895_11393 [Paenibacillus sophorae]|uniref:Uncharacterized protein n=1 Tax=Paenibacillus sophorae TaxID=1333845 RepID=A0A1H8T8Y0_9BACL|nr:hypothetical protein [Paenibacillus sophorae]QWU17137.1 hypothetical protein KP014_08195 [Paenibacillus sophorae]SEO87004.1 hypothetical protein SAMN04487895_11393 [Paenibacillus sophorae]